MSYKAAREAARDIGKLSPSEFLSDRPAEIITEHFRPLVEAAHTIAAQDMFTPHKDVIASRKALREALKEAM